MEKPVTMLNLPGASFTLPRFQVFHMLQMPVSHNTAIATGQFSVYRSATQRFVLHAVFWACWWVWVLNVDAVSWRLPFSDPSVIFDSTLVWLLTIATQQFLSRVAGAHILHKRWLLVLLDVLLVYLVMFYVIGAAAPWMAMQLFKNPFPHEYHFAPFTQWSVMLVASMFVWMMAPPLFIKVLLSFYQRQMARMNAVKEQQAMEVNLLRVQLQPQFLFNALAHIEDQVQDNTHARSVIQRFTNLLRFSVYESNRDTVSLQEETEFLQHYLLLEAMRHKESRVDLQYDFSKVADMALPIKPLLLVNFMENAFKHGLNGRIENAWAHFSLHEANGVLTFRAANSQPVKPATSRRGLGLHNVRRRLELEYPGRHQLEIEDNNDQYTITLTLNL